MNSLRKTSGLLFLFAMVIISLICAQPLFSDEPVPGETPEQSEEVPAASESVSGEVSMPAADPLLDNENLFNEDTFFFEASDLVFEVSPIIEPRTFNEIFPNLTRAQRLRARSGIGLRYSFEKDGSPTLTPSPDSGIDLLSIVMKKKPSHVIEALVLVPYKKRDLDLLDIYNALGRIKNIKDHKINIDGKDYDIFTDTTRLVSAKERKPIDDPAPVDILPYSETMYIRFLDPYIGDLYLKGEISISLYGITYSMTNFRDVSYYIFRVMKADRFSAILYLEPVKEGILIYSVSGLYLPNFIAKRINLTPNMNRRITVLLDWIIEGLSLQEDRRQDKHFYRLKPKTD